MTISDAAGFAGIEAAEARNARSTRRSDGSSVVTAALAIAPRRALLSRCWEPELVEHVAYYAAERGDAALEQLCNDVLAGATDEALVFAAIRADAALADWCGRDQHYRRREPAASQLIRTDELVAEAA